MHKRLHVITYDFNALHLATSSPKSARKSGLVVHTDFLIKGLQELTPNLDVHVTQTGSHIYTEHFAANGMRIFGRGINTHHPLLMDERGRKSAERVNFYASSAESVGELRLG